MGDAFTRFKALADKKKNIYDEDLLALVAEAGRAHRRALRAARSERHLVERRRAAGARAHAGRRRRARARRRGRRHGRRLLQGHRPHRRPQPAAGALPGQRHHRRHRCAGRSVVLDPRRAVHRQRAGRAHRHHHGQRAGLRERAQQARLPAPPSASASSAKDPEEQCACSERRSQCFPATASARR